MICTEGATFLDIIESLLQKLKSILWVKNFGDFSATLEYVYNVHC